jgi:hypothetical protein
MKLFVNLTLLFRNAVGRDQNGTCNWIGEPMDHPAIVCMTQHQLADLPMPAFAFSSRGRHIHIFACDSQAKLNSKQA